MRKKKKVARRDENLSGLMNFISFNLDNGVEVKSRRRRCRLCRMWPVLYARSQLSRQSRKIKVSEFHVDARENGENLKSVCVLSSSCVLTRESYGQFVGQNYSKESDEMTTDTPHIMVLCGKETANSATRKDVKVHLSFLYLLQCGRESVSHQTFSTYQHNKNI